MTEPNKKSSILSKIILVLFVLLIAGFGITYLVFNYSYSEGTRAGVLIKFAKQGFVFKTYEGELNIGGIGNIPNTAQMNQLWNFSVRDQAIADTLMKLESHKVALHYSEVVNNFSWQGETKFFVDGVKVIE